MFRVSDCLGLSSANTDLTIEVLSPPNAGEYALSIQSGGKPVCNYMVTTLEDANPEEVEKCKIHKYTYSVIAITCSIL